MDESRALVEYMIAFSSITLRKSAREKAVQGKHPNAT